MNKITFSLILITFSYHFSFSQVGIGTTTPSSELEIQTTNTGIPALELNAQTTPTGTATGQISLIGDRLYMYDATRAKWLSIETTALQFGTNGGADDERLAFGGDLSNGNSGAMMPFDGTIVYMTIESSGGLNTKLFDLEINGGNVGNNADPSLDGRINLSGGSFTRTTYNIDFDAGDYITLEVGSTGVAVQNPAGIIWVKWRQ